MWTVGAGIMVCGLLSMALIGIPMGLLIIGAGAALAGAASWAELQTEAKKNEWRKAYPSYKY